MKRWTPITWDTVEQLIAQRGRCDLGEQRIETKMNAEIERVKQRHARAFAAVEKARAQIDGILQELAEAHRDEMQSAGKGGGLVYRCLFGKIAFRKLPPKIKFLKKVEKVLAALKAAKLTDCIRTTEEPNKDVLLALDDDTLKGVHVKKTGGEQFEVVPDYEEIQKHG